MIEMVMPEWPIKDALMAREYENCEYENAWLSNGRCSWFDTNPSTTLKVDFHGDFNQNAFDSLVRWLAKAGYIKKPLRPERVIFNPPATIAFWNDGTKTVAKAKGGDEFDPLLGIMVCALRKVGRNRVSIDSWEPVIALLADDLASTKECRLVADVLNATADAWALDGVMGAMEEYDARKDTPDCQVFDTSIKAGTISAVGELETRVADIEKGRERTRQTIRDLIDSGEL